jgi:hypothetical protein
MSSSVSRAGDAFSTSRRSSWIADCVAPSMPKPRRPASSQARSMRTGSSRKRRSGSPIVRIVRRWRSSTPPVQSSTLKSAMS